jgi:DNA-binding NarL/FixJ family response regulator
MPRVATKQHSTAEKGRRSLRLLLADDHLVFLQALRPLLERHGFAVVGEAADGCEAVRLAARTRPDVAVLDLVLPLLNGVDATREIAQVSPATRVLLLAAQFDERWVGAALRAGVRGFVAKAGPMEELHDAIQEVARGGVHACPEVAPALLRAGAAVGGPESGPLTAREQEVLRLIAEGQSTKQVAALLGITFKTAESHRARIMAKLGIHETAGLVRYAIRDGLILP